MAENSMCKFSFTETQKTFIFSFTFALFSWTVGWFGFSWSWVLGFFVISLFWKSNAEKKQLSYVLTKSLYDNNINNDNKDIYKEKEILITKNKFKSAPSWVNFPDVERAEWLNQIIKQFWPFFSKMVADNLKEKVEPEIKKKLPSTIKSLKFTKTDLGNKPLRLGGIKVYTDHMPPNEIIADIELVYAGDALLEVALDNGIAAGISDIQIHGTLRMEMTPLLTKSPLIGGISLYFLDTPELNYNFTNLLNVLDVPGISHIVKNLLKETMESFVVFPNRIKIPIGEPADLDVFRFPRPKGVLKIDILEAKDLVAKDNNLFSKNTSDPYVVTKVGTYTHKTSVIQKSLNPKWNNEAAMMFVETIIGKKITFDLFDSDGLQDDDLGSASLSLHQVVDSSSIDLWLPLKNTPSGSLHVNCGWFNFSNSIKDLKKGKEERSQSCLFVLLDYATGLPATNIKKGTVSAFVEITINNKTVQSKTQRNTKQPVWEEVFTFFLSNPLKDFLKLKVYDENGDEPLGTIEYEISALADLPSMCLKQKFALRDCFENAQIFMSLELKALVPPNVVSSQ